MSSEDLKRRIINKQALIAIIGMGYVGLPLSIAFANEGFEVIGLDENEKRRKSINDGISYIDDVKGEELKKLIEAKKLRAVCDYSEIKKADVICICVPTPLDKNKQPDISYVKAVTNQLSKIIKKDQLVILESTTYPGTTEEVVMPKLEKSGLKAGKDFYLAFSPERVDPGNKKFSVKSIPKVVGGINEKSTKLAALLYSQIIEKIFEVSSPRVAEMEKLLENVFRSVNIALVNEMAILCKKMGIDIWEVVDAAKTKPYGFMPFYPGPGIGGHCLNKGEFLFIKDKDGMRTERIENFIDNTIKDSSSIKHKLKGAILCKPQDKKILSFDPVSGQTCFKDIKLLSKRDYSGNAFKITTQDGRKIIVTDKHPMIVFNGCLGIKFAKDLEEGDELPVINGLPFNKKIIPNSFLKRKSKFTTVKVQSLVPVKIDTAYSVEVADTNTFVSSYGIVTHNCIPLDPFYLSWKAKEYGIATKFIELAGEINDKMPEYVIELVQDALNKEKKSLKNSKIAVLGVSYKKDICDTRESPALKIIDLLIKKDASVTFYDPYVDKIKLNGSFLHSSDVRNLRECDCAIIATDHSNFDFEQICRNIPLVIDTRNAVKKANGKMKVVKI